jgi:hypothetical protein
LPANFRFNGLLCSWQTPTYLPQQVTIGQITNPPNYEKVSNFYTCQLERSQDSGACTPPMISGPTPNSCVCPQGMQMEGKECVIVQRACPAPMVPSPVRGECVCPAGTVLTGNKCVRPVVCRPPLVPNAADTACACPEGTVLTGKKCVSPVVCRPPMIPNGAGACMCPRGMTNVEGQCIPSGRNNQHGIGPGFHIPFGPGGGGARPANHAVQ